MPVFSKFVQFILYKGIGECPFSGNLQAFQEILTNSTGICEKTIKRVVTTPNFYIIQSSGQREIHFCGQYENHWSYFAQNLKSVILTIGLNVKQKTTLGKNPNMYFKQIKWLLLNLKGFEIYRMAQSLLTPTFLINGNNRFFSC